MSNKWLEKYWAAKTPEEETEALEGMAEHDKRAVRIIEASKQNLGEYERKVVVAEVRRMTLEEVREKMDLAHGSSQDQLIRVRAWLDEHLDTKPVRTEEDIRREVYQEVLSRCNFDPTGDYVKGTFADWLIAKANPSPPDPRKEVLREVFKVYCDPGIGFNDWLRDEIEGGTE